jgi:multiple antibiotic resistance protein
VFETVLVSFATIFATIGPFDVALVFASLTARHTPKERTATAVRGIAISTGILLVFAACGESLLKLFGISLPALRIGGGILLMMIAIDLAFAKTSGAMTTTDQENEEARMKSDIATFPLATPLIAGPGAMGAVVLLMAEAETAMESAMVILGLLSVLIFTLICLLLGAQVQKKLGRIGADVVARVFGVLLAGLAVQFILDGLAHTPLFGG